MDCLHSTMSQMAHRMGEALPDLSGKRVGPCLLSCVCVCDGMNWNVVAGVPGESLQVF